MTEPAIDTHLHVWRLADGWYGWNTPAYGAVHADAELTEVARDLPGAGIVEVVLVQAADHPGETDRLLSLAAEHDRVRGVVGWADLTSSSLASDLRRPGLVGVRQLWHDHDDPAELTRPPVLRGIEAIGAASLPVDVPDAFPRLAGSTLTMINAVPGTTVVIDHAGKPPFGDREAWPQWEDWFTTVASAPNAVIKLSGLFGGSGSTRAAREDELDRVVELTHRHAGAARTMIGSDWPMTRGALAYGEAMARIRSLLANWPLEDQRMALVGTAQRVYSTS